MIDIKVCIEVEYEYIEITVRLNKDNGKLGFAVVENDITEDFETEDILEALSEELKIVDLNEDEFYNLVEMNFSGSKNDMPLKPIFLVTRDKVFDCDLKQLSPFKYNVDDQTLFQYLTGNIEDLKGIENA